MFHLIASQKKHIVHSALCDSIRKCIYLLAKGRDSCIRLWVWNTELIFYLLMKVFNSLYPSLTWDVPEVEVRVWDHLDLFQRYFFYSQILLDNKQHVIQLWTKHICPCFWSGSCSETFKKHTTTQWPEEDGDRGTDFQREEEPRCLTAAIQMLWNEYKYDNYVT